MNKNYKIILCLIFLILNSAFLIPLRAQFLNAIGVTVGATYSNQRWTDNNLNTIERKKYILGFNGSVFAEFFSHDYIRWVSEFQFNQKGSLDKMDSVNFTTKLNYICFNNYLKFRLELFNIIPYFLVGPRIEYRLSQQTDHPRITGNFVPLHVSLAAGLGLELVSYGPIKVFAEAFYNPDLIDAYNVNDLHIKNNAFELRIGAKYVFGKKNKKDMDCNSPTYIPY